MSGFSGYSTIVPRIVPRPVSLTIEPDGGSNPINGSAVAIQDARGDPINYILVSKDNDFMCSFELVGGYGRWPEDQTNNFFFRRKTNVNCTVTTTSQNVFEIVTPASDAGGRTYELRLYRTGAKVPPTIEQTAGAVIGNNDFVVRTVTFSLKPFNGSIM